MDIKEINKLREELLQKLSLTHWDKVFKDFINSEEFDKIILFLYNSKQKGVDYTPSYKEIFKPFFECDYNDLKVVIVGQDPYSSINTADGLAFSCSKNTLTPQPSLEYILKSINHTVYDDSLTITPNDFNLKRWANQGVLLLNTALTTELNKVGTHFEVWKPFIDYLFKRLNENNYGLIVLFLGNKAKEFNGYFNSNLFYKLYASHPASAAYNNFNYWECNDCFNEINNILLSNNNTKIIW